jgi:cytochrome c oxidase subunit 1
MMNKKLGYLHFWITLLTAYGVFFPMHFLGLAGVPRRYYTNSNFPLFDHLGDINEFITIAAIIAALAQLVFLVNFFYSMFRGQKAPQNPWNSNTLEWTTPMLHNIFMVTGQVHYLRFTVGHMITVSLVLRTDFIPQTVPLGPDEHDGGGH